jgi:hypothetical protein
MRIIYKTSDGERVYDPLNAEQYPDDADREAFRSAIIDQLANDKDRKKAAADPEYADLLASHLLLCENASAVYEELSGLSKPFTYPKWVIDAARKNADESTNDIMRSDIEDIIADSDDYDTLVSELRDYCKS